MPIVRIPARIEYVGSGGPGFNIWHARTVDTGPGDLNLVLDALEGFYTSIAGLYAASSRVVIGEAMIKDPLGAPEFLADDSRTITGGGAFTVGPQPLAVVVGWRTVSATRSGRGRTFLGPFTVGAQDQADGTPNGGTLSIIRDAAQELVESSNNPSLWSIGVLSTKQGVLRDITGSSVRDRWAVLRSRRD
jgi:hypothetical protein